MMNSFDNMTIGSEIAYKNLENTKTDLQKLIQLGLIKKDRIPMISALYDANDAGNRSYIKGQESVAAGLGIPYTSLNTNLLADDGDVLEIIKNQNNIDLIGALFIANPIHTNLDFQKTIDTVTPIKDIDGLSTFHKSKYISQIAQNLEGVYLHPTALSVVDLLKKTLGEDLTNKKILVAGGGGKVGSMIAALLNLVGAYPETYNPMPDTYNPDELESLLPNHDGFVSVVRGIGMFDGGLFDKFQGPIIDVTTGKNTEGKTAGAVKIINFDPQASHIYIPPTRGGVGTITKTWLMTNYIRAITQKLKTVDEIDEKHLQDIIHKTDNSDIINPITVN